jgi:flagellar biosynthesis/type III secretory pathway M-ring protein FliF/YscJ
MLLAHIGHWWTWLLYVPVVLIVLFSIVRTLLSERRGQREEPERR